MRHYDVVFDGPPGPDGGRFVEVEREDGSSFQLGDWLQRSDGRWVLRVRCSIDLGELLATQAGLQEAMGWPGGTGEWGAKENLLHAMVEVTEALRELNFKPWKPARPVDLVRFATEITDVLQFLANAANAVGLTQDDLSMALRAKWQENRRRLQAGEVLSAPTS